MTTPTHHEQDGRMSTSGLLCKPMKRVDYRPTWMRQGLSIPLAAKWDQDSTRIPKEEA